MKTVSIIVPCYNEEKTIAQLLEGIQLQQYPIEELEVVIADGFSEDGTRGVISRYKQEHQDLSITVVDNELRTIPSGLNAAIKSASGEFIIRLDAHSIPNRDYVARCVKALQDNLGQNVGGVWKVQPGDSSWIAKSIAAAGSHPLGVGDAGYRYATESAYVDTIPFGAYRRELIEKIGYYNETLLTNEDYELNVRIRQAGGKILLDPAIQSTYFARSSLSALAQQYWRYGFWKAQMLRKYPETIRLRQALPPLFVLGILLLLLIAPFSFLVGYLLLGILALYFGILFLTSIGIALQKKNGAFIMGIPLAVTVMHFCWGGGFLYNLVNPKRIH